MSFRYGGGKKRRDTNEPVIVQALRAVGASTYQLTGTRCPDLLVFFRGVCYPMEIKTSTGKLKPSQVDVPWPIVRSVEQALAIIGVSKAPQP